VLCIRPPPPRAIQPLVPPLRQSGLTNQAHVAMGRTMKSAKLMAMRLAAVESRV